MAIITVIISITGVVANTLLQASSISYKTSNGDTTDVNSALDRLFDINYKLFSVYGDMTSTTQNDIFLYQGVYLVILGSISNGQPVNCSLYVMTLGNNNVATYNKLSEGGHAALSGATFNTSTNMFSFTTDRKARYSFFRIE